ncbi:MAG TPA: N-acetylglucosamine-6-phosphate deacetylase [Candidatus Binataceae bacterium]|nr:N-acetylglucosamine-6-phosphate deacetylase [Candidatus Binataceae bacterium]
MTTLKGVIARPDGTLAQGKISFGAKIDSIEQVSQSGGDLILPGLIDLQVNGSHGIDVMSATAAQIAALGRHLAKEGTTAWLPTGITAPIDRIERVHDAIADAMDESDPDAQCNSATILGMHLEGPFISPARLGAHPPLNLEPHSDALERVLAMRALRLITLAPELPRAVDAIGRFIARGVTVSIGHSNATLEEANDGIAAGARMFTHLFNAMRPMHHRDPGVIAAALAPSSAMAALIPDEVHVHPELLRLAYRVRGKDGLILVTDKVALAETAGRGRAQVKGGAARLADGTLAGSVISMLDGVRVMIERCGVGAGEAAVMAASNPARLIGAADRGRLEIGMRADLLILNAKLELKAVYIGGRELR